MATTAVLTPSLSRTALTPVAAVPTSVSPTPQKDGRVLGLFDLLSGTPSKSTVLSAVPNQPFSAVTPSKRRATDVLSTAATTTTITTATTPTTARFATTPQSKRTTTITTTTETTTQLLFPTASTTPRHGRNNKTTTPFRTPSTNRVTKQPPSGTPTSATPSFLRRRTLSITAAAATATATLSRVDEQDEEAAANAEGRDREEKESWAARAVGPLRLPRKFGGIGRSLSSVVAGLRKMEEEAFEEEEAVMREMEMGMDMEMDMGMGGGGGGGGGGYGKGAERKGGLEVEVGDSQVLGHSVGGGVKEKGNAVPGGLLSGFDDEALYDSLDDEKQRGQQPLRQFKKRGQKRTTRLVNMRPTRARRPAQNQPGADGHDQEDEDEDDLVPETQFNAARPPLTTATTDDNDLRLLSDLDSDLDFDGSAPSDGEEIDKASAKSKPSKKKPATTSRTKTAATEPEKAKGEGVVKRAVRKVKATAHANFKRLKLRNTGSKGGPGHNSRFRRRR